MGQFACDGTCSGNDLGDCSHPEAVRARGSALATLDASRSQLEALAAAARTAFPRMGECSTTEAHRCPRCGVCSQEWAHERKCEFWRLLRQVMGL